MPRADSACLCHRDFTFVCPTEILAFNDALPQFQALNTAVLGKSAGCACV